MSLFFAPLLAGDVVPKSAALSDVLEDVKEKGTRRLQRRRETIEDWLSRRGAFTTLVSLLVATGLAPDGPFDQPGDFTLFAPTNNAFDYTFSTYPGLDAFLTSPEGEGALLTVLQYHVLATRVLAGNIPRSGVTVETLSGERLTAFRHCYGWWGWRYCDVYLQDGTADYAQVTHANFRVNNGVIHAIDKVLIPPSLAPTVEALRVNRGFGH